ncbi:MAG: aspartate-semialdehyde dehydrogenase [Candidatus Heimdallarchaeota archaeon]|nr:aspartate-semialdehyde dehydrogenase [Candidatus Heimdallarchaeota archaeon]
MKKMRVGILGATGLVGQQFTTILNKHPFFELVCITASERSAAKRYGEAVDWKLEEDIPNYLTELKISRTTVKDILKEDIKIIFSALPAVKAQEIETRLAKEGIAIFTNASTHRMDNDVPILIPEINPEHMQLVKKQQFNNGFIVANSNCSTAGLVFGLKPLEKFGIRSVYVTTYQSISGAGRNGVVALDILGNIIPYINKEEEKIELESRKILGKFTGEEIHNADFYVNASCARVPVFNGHLESVVVELEEDVNLGSITNAYGTFRGANSKELPTAPIKPIILTVENDRPQPAKDLRNPKNRGMAVTIGRLRKKGNRVNFFLLVHNIMRGSAGASVLNAEYAFKERYL